MTYLLKDPEAELDYLVDWRAEYLGADDELASSSWTVEPIEAGGIDLTSNDFTADSATVTAGGGTAGRVYRLINQVTTASGRSDTRSITLRVESR